MIEVQDLIRKIRYKANDLNEVKYSDYDILQAINEVIDCINLNKSLQNSDFLEKAETFNQDDYEEDFADKGLVLPYDFITLVGVVRTSDNYQMHPVGTGDELIDACGTYKIIGGRIYTKEKEIKLIYRARIEAAEATNDDVFLPEIFTNVVVNTSLIALNTGTSTLQQSVDQAVESIVPRRRYAHARARMPFYC